MTPTKSLRGKFIGTMLLVIGLVGISTLILVAILNTQASSQHLSAVSTHIEEGIKSKGRVLTENHAIAMRSLVLDNAYLDMQRLVERAVAEDNDLVYGIYVSAEKQALAYCQRGVPCGADKVVDKETWRPLGLNEADLVASALQIRQAHRLGTELLEVAMPVRGEDQTPVGTIRYGLSTKRMQDAIQAAKLEANSRLKRSLLIIGGIVGLCTLLGVLLSRFQAVRITRPVSDLTKAAGELASGNRSVRVAIHSGDELEVLGGSFNQMVEDLDASYSKLEEMNRTLEQKVQNRTAELATKNRDMRLVLDNVDQGFVTLSAKGVMAAERSRVVDDWFGSDDAPRTFSDFLNPHSQAFAMTFRMAWSQLEEDFLPIELSIDQLPKQLSLPKKTFSLRYLPFIRDEHLDGVLVVIADITEKLQREREEAEQGELMQGFKRLMLDRSGFSNFLAEATAMIESIATPGKLDELILKRTLHTLKGNSAVMGLVVVARLCHTLEDQLAESGEMSEDTLTELTARWEAISDHISTFIGADKPRTIEVPEAEYASLVSKLSKDVHGDVLNQLLNWQLEPVTKPFERLAEQARGLTKRLGKGELNVVIESGNVRLDPDTWTPFFSSLVHVIRNSVDHGLETQTERTALGKSEAGTLILKASTDSHSLTFEIGDDGRGIDWEAVARRGKALGLPVQSHEHLVDALLHDGVSTKSEVSDLSGRGVGMGAVAQRVYDMQGQLEVRTAKHSGTTWVIRFPWNPKSIPTVPMRKSIAPKGPRPPRPEPTKST